MVYILGALAFLVLVYVFVTLGAEGIVKSIVIGGLSIMLLIACIAHANVYDKSKYQETVQTNSYDLVTLQDESQVSGNLRGRSFYVYASLETNEVYNFYYKTEDGGFRKGKVDASKAVVYEQDETAPVVVEYTIYTKSKMSETMQKICYFGVCNEQTSKNYKIYIPKGTITNEYVLDAQ